MARSIIRNLARLLLLADLWICVSLAHTATVLTTKAIEAAMARPMDPETRRRRTS